MSTSKNSREDFRDESLEMQNDVDRQAGVGSGLGDRSASGLNSPGRTGLGGGINADELRMPTSGATDPSLDENEADYADGDTTDTKAPNDGADRNVDEGSADSRGKADFMNIESEDDR